MKRRQLLQTLGTAGVAALAGCNTQDDGTATTTALTTRTSTDTPTSTEEPTETTEQWDIDPVEHDKLVGSYYYGWYENPGWLDRSPSTPVLGEYNSRDQNVINQHIKWAREHGINTFVYRWGGPDSWDETTLLDHVLEAELGDQIDIMIQPSAHSLTPGDYEWGTTINFDKPENRQHLKDLFRHLEDEFFELPNYSTLDGRPPVTFFGIDMVQGGDLGGALAEAKRATSATPFLIGDVAGYFDPGVDVWLDYAEQIFSSLLPEMDALTNYSLYNPGALEGRNFDEYIDYQHEIGLYRRLGADSKGLGFVPTVMPGADDSLVRGDADKPVIPPTPERFEQFIDSQIEYVDQDLNAVFVTSFNEWYEDTPVEPREEYGTAFLETIENRVVAAEDPPLDIDEHYHRIRFDFNRTVIPEGAGRDLAWYIGEIELQNGKGSVISRYDIGSPEAEPIFIEGVYGPEQLEESDVPTRRWFGGPTGQSVFYTAASDGEPATAQVVGYPIEPDEIEADVFFNGERTDHVALGNPDGFGTYTLSLAG